MSVTGILKVEGWPGNYWLEIKTGNHWQRLSVDGEMFYEERRSADYALNCVDYVMYRKAKQQPLRASGTGL